MSRLTRHQQARRALAVNTSLFVIASAALAVILLGDILRHLVAGSAWGWWGMTLTLVLWLLLGWGNFRGAWRSFSRMAYGTSQFQGFLSWLSSWLLAWLAWWL
ncbi:MAG: hypothetical protein Q6L50_02385 [Gloeomargarita sp. GMQP_bins_120]